VFADADEVRETLTRDQRQLISAAYLDFEKEYSPNLSRMSDVEFDALLDEVKKNPSSTRLNDLNTATLKKLITILASPLLR
jgi:hypothetical protein